MKMKTVVVLAFAVGCGLIAMVGVQQMISQQSNPAQDQPISVLVATVDISPGVLLNEHNCEFKEIPAKGVPSDAVREKAQYTDRGLRVPVMAGDIIRMTKLGARGEIAASASIPKGMRTFSIQVNDTKTHSGLLQPGDRVDLQVTYEIRFAEGFKQTKSAIFLEYIEVFASDSFRNLEAGESKEIKAKNITLLVTPQQANYIQLANSKGELMPIMRSKTDNTLTYENGLDENVLVELQTGQAHDVVAKQIAEAKKEEPKPEPKPEPRETAQAFKDFLDGADAKPANATEVTAPSEVWTITIFAGDDIITQEVALKSNGDSDTQNSWRTNTTRQTSNAVNNSAPNNRQPRETRPARPEETGTRNENKPEPESTEAQQATSQADGSGSRMKQSFQEFLDRLTSGKPLVEPIEIPPGDDGADPDSDFEVPFQSRTVGVGGPN